MTRPRFSLRSATCGIVLVAVGLAALKFPNRYATAGLYTLTLAVLLAATLAAVVRRDRSTALGAALFGWGFLLMTMVGWLRGPYDELIVGPLLEDVYPRIHSVRDSAIATESTSTSTGLASGRPLTWNTRATAFGSSAWAPRP